MFAIKVDRAGELLKLAIRPTEKLTYPKADRGISLIEFVSLGCGKPLNKCRGDDSRGTANRSSCDFISRRVFALI